jgi:hypothetical protein
VIAFSKKWGCSSLIKCLPVIGASRRGLGFNPHNHKRKAEQTQADMEEMCLSSLVTNLSYMLEKVGETET